MSKVSRAVRRASVSAVLLAALATPVFAQSEKAVFNEPRLFEVAWSPAYLRQGDVGFAGGGLDFKVHLTTNVALVADLTAGVKRVGPIDLTLTTYRFGPRGTVRRGKRVTTFGQVLIGGATVSALSESQRGLSAAIGGGVDVGVANWFALRVAEFEYSAIRFQNPSGTSSGFRVGGGLVFRFGGQP